MNKTPLSIAIGGAGLKASGLMRAAQSLNLGQLIRSMFSNSEQGFAYDINDLSTLYQDAAGTIPVTGAGQPVGLVLDKSKGLVLGPELFSDATVTFNGAGGETVTRLSAGLYRFVSTSNLIYLGLPSIGQAQDRYLLVDYEIVRLASGDLRFDNGGGRQVAIPPVVGRRTMGLMATTLTIARRTAPVDCDIRIHSICEVVGNHAYQTTSSMRPLLLNSPRKIDYDGVDDKLTVNLPAQLTGCTVIRAVPNVGTQILTNQTIPTPYNDSTDHCGLIVINRALTQTETAQITQIFNRLAGV